MEFYQLRKQQYVFHYWKYLRITFYTTFTQSNYENHIVMFPASSIGIDSTLNDYHLSSKQ